MVTPTCGEGAKQLCDKSQTLETVDQIRQASRYDRMNIQTKMDAVASHIDAHPDTALEDLRAMAAKNRPEDAFLKRGDAVGSGDPLDRFMKAMKT